MFDKEKLEDNTWKCKSRQWLKQIHLYGNSCQLDVVCCMLYVVCCCYRRRRGYLHEASYKVRGGVSFPSDETLSEFGETAVGHHGQPRVDFLQDTGSSHSLTLRRTREVWGGITEWKYTSSLSLTLRSPVSLSLYWSPVTQPSSSCKLVTVPSTNVTLGGAVRQLEKCLLNIMVEILNSDGTVKTSKTFCLWNIIDFF